MKYCYNRHKRKQCVEERKQIFAKVWNYNKNEKNINYQNQHQTRNAGRNVKTMK